MEALNNLEAHQRACEPECRLVMNTLYFDCFSGISGDMTIAALLDLGCSQKHLEAELRKLGLSKEYHLHFSRGKQQQVTGFKFDVHTSDHHDDHHHHGHEHHHGGHHHHDHHEHGRTYDVIRKLIERSKLSSFVKKHALNIFEKIAIVEGKIHGVPTKKVHFHEVGGIDSIIDIVGTCVLIEELSPKQILASVPCEGHGFVECAHGRFPVPTTATLELLKNIPLRQIDIPGELITPTGAAILSEFVQNFAPLSNFTTQKIGYGLGTRTYPNHPNVLRVLLGEATSKTKYPSDCSVDVIETNIDDVTPELIASTIETLIQAGSRDVFVVPIQMKKGRSGSLLTVLSDPTDTERLSSLILNETGSFGLRIRRSERICLDREKRNVKTQFGIVEIKIGRLQNEVISAKPEFESCKRLAQKLNKPVRLIWVAAITECTKLIK
jgi:pyridinium-3,5-bisthiocarboxylic acid mononucleotide nickel chelatase